MSASLELRDVVKHYVTGIETVKAVDGVSLTVSAGEFVALYGPSGSGKTTLLMLSAALSTPDSGSVRFDGRVLAELSECDSALYRRRDVGFIFQAFHLMQHTSALDNATIKLIGDGYTLREGRRRALPWLERVGLAPRADYTPEQLSMGERQRIAIARALANEPRLLLADEPTGNLDSKRSQEIFGLLRDICHERAIPAVLATHDPQATEFVDRVLTTSVGGVGSSWVVDPLGRTVHLTVERWEHIVDGHPYMAPYRDELLRAIEEPTERIAEPRPRQDWFYLKGAGPSEWLKVVVTFNDQSVGSVRTAFPRRSKP